MSIESWQRILDQATAVPGVRGAVVVSIDDGLVVAESAMDNLETADVAALAAAVIQRSIRVSRAAQHQPPRAIRLAGQDGSVVAFAADEALWLVAIADHSAEQGRLRLLLGDLAATIG